ncbi:MAG: nucleotide-binding protein [Pseudomonadales bacterium]|nr:nucleotide-binding protein [Pseudomonadales bacterium]
MPEKRNNRSNMEELWDRLRVADKILSGPKVGSGQLKMWSGSVRGQFRQIFGQESTLAKTWLPKNIPDSTDPRAELARRARILNDILELIEQADIDALSNSRTEKRVFIGHGQSPLWRELKDFISDRLGLSWDEFNREAVAGFTTFERISEMLDEASFAFLIMTAEDQHQDATTHARQNVVHEVGLFQGRLGPKRAIILLEEGCSEFSNIVGLSQVRFPEGRISAIFEDVRRVLEREGIVNA